MPSTSRSTELLACARTAFKLLKNTHSTSTDFDQSIISTNTYSRLEDVVLYNTTTITGSIISDLDTNSVSRDLEDATLHYSSLELVTQQLAALVKRRGHTNDPQAQIEQLIQEFQQYLKDLLASTARLKSYSKSSSNVNYRPSPSEVKHYQIIGSCLEKKGEELTQEFQNALSVRSHVLSMQSARRKMLTNNQSSDPPGEVNNGNSVSEKNPVRDIPKQLSTSVLSSNRNQEQMDNKNNKLSTGPRLPVRRSGAISARTQLSSPLFTTTGANRKPSINTATSVKSSANGTSLSNGSSYMTKMVNNYSKTSQNSSGISGGIYDRNTGNSSSSSMGNYSYNGSSNQNLGMRRRNMNTGVESSRRNDNTSRSAASYYGTTSQNYYQQHYSETANQIQAQEQQKSVNSKERVDNARHIESTIADLGKVFSRMATLVAQQSETLQNIEDDVEASLNQVNAGHAEIEKVFELVKGNRGLIVKVFVLLVIFILFMRLY